MLIISVKIILNSQIIHMYTLYYIYQYSKANKSLPDIDSGAEGSSTMIRRPSGAIFILSSVLDDLCVFIWYSFIGFDTTKKKY